MSALLLSKPFLAPSLMPALSLCMGCKGIGLLLLAKKIVWEEMVIVGRNLCHEEKQLLGNPWSPLVEWLDYGGCHWSCVYCRWCPAVCGNKSIRTRNVHVALPTRSPCAGLAQWQPLVCQRMGQRPMRNLSGQAQTRQCASRSLVAARLHWGWLWSTTCVFLALALRTCTALRLKQM